MKNLKPCLWERDRQDYMYVICVGVQSAHTNICICVKGGGWVKNRLQLDFLILPYDIKQWKQIIFFSHFNNEY